jgi:hypothetical protein
MKERQHLAGKRRVSGVTGARNQTSLNDSARSSKALMLAFIGQKYFCWRAYKFTDIILLTSNGFNTLLDLLKI